MISSQSLESLVAKYGAEALAQGVNNEQWAHETFVYNHPTPTHPQPYQFPGAAKILSIEPPKPEPKVIEQPQPEETNTTPTSDGRVKIYPQLAFSAIKHNLGGAWRAWTIAKMIDKRGAGSVTQKELSNTLKELGVSKFNCSRWLSAAVSSGLFRQYRGIYYLTGLGKAASIVLAQAIGLPALVDPHALMEKNWRALVWSGYLATLHERPVSQNTKAGLTGIDPRTQRNYQAAEPGAARGNYAKTQYKPNQVAGLNEVTGGGYFSTRLGQVVRRLPDLRNVPIEVAITAPKGRSRKAQQELIFSSYVGREPDQPTRLFCGSPKQTKAAERKIAKSDKLPWNRPQEIYQLIKVGSRNNLFDTIHLGEQIQ